MSKKFKPRKKKTIEDKIREFDQVFVDEALSATSDQLKDKLMKMAAYDEEMERMRKEDTDLASCKATYDAALETYTMPIKNNKLKRTLIVEIMRGRSQV